MKCPECGSPEIYEVGRDSVRREVLSWKKDGWPDRCGPMELDGGCYDIDEDHPLECDRCGYAWNPSNPEGGDYLTAKT